MDKDLKYINDKKNLISNRTGYSISKLLDFLDIDYQYNASVSDTKINIDFKIGMDKFIKILENDKDIAELKIINEKFPSMDLIAIGKSSFIGKINELDSFFLFNKKIEQIGSVFIEIRLYHLIMHIFFH